MKYILLLSMIVWCSCRSSKQHQFNQHMAKREKLIVQYTDSAIAYFMDGDTAKSLHWFSVALNVDSVLKVKHK